MVPFNDNKRGIKVAQFQIGYKGYIQLAIRSGQYKDIDVTDVREGEYLGRDKTTGKYKFEFIEDDTDRESRKIVGYMAYFEYLNGFTKSIYWSKEKMLLHADKYSQAFSLNATTGKFPKVSYADYEAGKVAEKDMWKYSSYWYKDFNGMACKTMLRQLISKWGIMSIDMQTAMEKDMAEIKANGDYEYIENSDEEINDFVETTNVEENPIEPETTTVTEPTEQVKEETTKDEPKNEQPEQTGDNVVDEFFS